MYWQESNDGQQYVVPGDIVDVAFGIRCRTLPVDHAWALSSALRAVLPWLEGEAGAGIHPIHVAESGNGWMRPESGELLYPSRRTRLMLRLPHVRLAAAAQLAGHALDIAGHRLEVEARPAVRQLSDITTLFARYVLVADNAQPEEAFLANAHAQLVALGIRPKKMLCGMERVVRTPEGELHTRSLMLADLTMEESVRLQQQGLGPQRLLGCGLFVPHKGIREVGAAQS